jgi:acyl carrier protein
MASAETDVLATISSFLHRVEKPTELDPGTRLYADGIGLDSLETAELSAMLEDELGSDPFGAGEMPQTVGDILAFYGSAAVPQA